MSEEVKSYKDLIVWQKSMKLATLIFETTKTYPKSELYGLVNQIRRASFSIPSNIAEGFCRGGRAEFRQFLQIAFASGAELETELEISKNTSMLDEQTYSSLMEQLSEIMRMLNRMITNIRNFSRK